MPIRFRLCKLDDADFQLVYRWRQDPDTLRYSFHSEPEGETSYKEKYYSELKDAENLCLFAVDSHGPVAFLKVNPAEEEKSCLVGINLCPEKRGQGLGVEILRALRLYLREQTSYEFAWAEILLENAGSQKAFEKAGFLLIDQATKRVEDIKKSFQIYRYRTWLRLPSVKAWAFDFDGTLVDSTPFLKKTYFKFLSEYGHEGTDDEFDALNGPRLIEVVEVLRRKYRIEESADQLLKKYTASIQTSYLTMELDPKLRQSLNLLKSRSLKLAIASSNSSRLIKEFLRLRGVEHFFDLILSASDVQKSKPSPEIYQKVVASFSIHPDELLVVEDSRMGAESALEAGARLLYLGPQLDLSLKFKMRMQTLKEIGEIAEWLS